MTTTTHFMRNVTSLAVLFLLSGATFLVAADEVATKKKEQELIAVLRSKPPEEKAIACKELAIYGSQEAVPELAKLLSDEQLSSWSRIALEAIPSPAADAALLKATDSVKGLLLVGTINSIGVRKDAHAVDRLAVLLKEQDAQVASASAVALGRIGNDVATKSLRKSLNSTTGAVQSAVAEGCILCAERLMAAGKASEAAAIYDEVRKADVPKPRLLEATRGAILARKTEGIPLLIEQLKSTDKGYFQIGLITARQLPGREVADALAGELTRTTPDRAALLLSALVDRKDSVLPHAVLAAAKSGDKQVRMTAIEVVGRRGDASSLPTLLEISTDDDAELAETAKTALAVLPGKKVNAEIASRLSNAKGKELAVLIEVVGQRRIDATDALVRAVKQSDPAIRSAALTALGETAGPKDLSVLIAQVIEPQNPLDAQVAERALKAASIRMPDRDACAAELAAAMPRASKATKVKLLEIVGAVGGQKSLQTIAAAMKGGSDEELQDAGSRLLGRWMNVDAAPVLLNLAKDSSAEKYQTRALRGYIRLARQFTMPDRQRAAMCQSALDASPRAEEQKLILAVLERYPSMDTLKVAANATKVPAMKEDAGRVTLIIAQKLGTAGVDTRKILATAGLDPMKVEIVKAEYGAGADRKDVTQTLQKQVHELPLITLKSASYNESFGGDPAPGAAKQLKVKYRIDGKVGEASFSENAPILLPTPK